jgi:hypothetical protein
VGAAAEAETLTLITIVNPNPNPKTPTGARNNVGLHRELERVFRVGLANATGCVYRQLLPERAALVVALVAPVGVCAKH